MRAAPSIKVRPNHRPSDQQILIWAQQQKGNAGGTSSAPLLEGDMADLVTAGLLLQGDMADDASDYLLLEGDMA